jgi:hypothetical protein
MVPPPTNVDGASAEPGVPPEFGPPSIFIGYSDHERQFAIALGVLIDSWGFEARLPERRQLYLQLAEDLASSDLVLLLLSNEFEHDPRCQAEAAAAVALGKPLILILIPPVGNIFDLPRMSPALDDPDRKLIDGSRPQLVIAELGSILAEHFATRGYPRLGDADTKDRRDQVRSSLTDVNHAYEIEPPIQALVGVWPTLTDTRTHHSITQNLIRAVAAGEASVAVVGVSLKYSIDILTAALQELAAIQPARRPGPLTIELVHMDDQSHILNSLQDSVDINSVLKNFHVGWPETKARWLRAGESVGVTINVREPIAIDYIPQQVGVRIRSFPGRWSVLYAGRCSFQQAGDGGARLLVGEREYLFYKSSGSANARDDEAIAVFDQYVDQYRSTEHNGAMLVAESDRTQWISRLETCVQKYQDLDQLVLVSNTTTKFLPLIAPALKRGIPVKVYSSDPGLPMLRETDKAMIDLLVGRVKGLVQPEWPGQAELRYFHDLPTFRAVLIGNAVLGFQSYTSHTNDEKTLTLSSSAMRLIVTRHSQHFESLREMIFGFLRASHADAKPYAVLPERAHEPSAVSAATAASIIREESRE